MFSALLLTNELIDGPRPLDGVRHFVTVTVKSLHEDHEMNWGGRVRMGRRSVGVVMVALTVLVSAVWAPSRVSAGGPTRRNV